MSKQTFDFSEALKKMKQGKKVRRSGFDIGYMGIDNDGNVFIRYKLGRDSTSHIIPRYWSYFSLEDILATDWEEVEE